MEGNRPQRKVDKSGTKPPKSIETSGNNTGKERVSKIPATSSSKIPARQTRLSVIASEGNEASDLTGGGGTGSTMNIL